MPKFIMQCRPFPVLRHQALVISSPVFWSDKLFWYNPTIWYVLQWRRTYALRRSDAQITIRLLWMESSANSAIGNTTCGSTFHYFSLVAEFESDWDCIIRYWKAKWFQWSPWVCYPRHMGQISNFIVMSAFPPIIF
jgi:hypothetical protein